MARSPDSRDQLTAAADPTAAAFARFYDLDLVDDPGDLSLYEALANRTGGPVLELGVGTGRLAIPLARAGHRVTGVDLDPAMLDRARRALGASTASRLTLVHGDARSIRLPDAGAFRLAFLPLNSIFLMGSRRDQAAVVSTLAAHLASGGLAVVDAWLPDADDLARYDGRLVLEWVRADPSTGRTVAKMGAALHDAATRTVRLTTIYDEAAQGAAPVRWIREDRLRLVSPDELESFAEQAGLVVETVAGDYDLSPLGPGSDRAILVAGRP